MNSLKHYWVIIAISLLPLLSVIFSPDMPHTHDGPVHLARIAAYYKAFNEGQILPRWAGELNYGYGMPLFNYMYHVPYLVSLIPLYLGLGLVAAFKFSLVLSFILSGLCMYMFGLRFFTDRTKAFILAALYQFAPYHLVDTVVRGDFGETWAFAFFPLVLWAIVRANETKALRNAIVPIGVAAALLILSHNSVSLMFFGVAVLFVLFLLPRPVQLRAGAGLLLGLVLAAFYWVPAMAERRFTYGDLFMKDMYKSHFAPLYFFFLPNLTNHPALQIGGIAVSIGLAHLAALATGFWRFVKQPRSRTSTIWFILLLLAASFFIMQPVSQFLWERIALLRIFQFPWRVMAIVVFALSFLGAYLVPRKLSRVMLVIILTVTVLPTLVYWTPPLGFDRVNETEYWNYPLNTTYFGETDLVWSGGPQGSYPDQRFEVIEGEGVIANPQKTGTRHTFAVTAATDVRILDRTQYFPGWRAYAGEQKIPIEFQDMNQRGLITFRLPPGRHNVLVAFGESPVRTIAEIISVSAFVILLFLSAL